MCKNNTYIGHLLGERIVEEELDTALTTPVVGLTPETPANSTVSTTPACDPARPVATLACEACGAKVAEECKGGSGKVVEEELKIAVPADGAVGGSVVIPCAELLPSIARFVTFNQWECGDTKLTLTSVSDWGKGFTAETVLTKFSQEIPWGGSGDEKRTAFRVLLKMDTDEGLKGWVNLDSVRLNSEGKLVLAWSYSIDNPEKKLDGGEVVATPS